VRFALLLALALGSAWAADLKPVDELSYPKLVASAKGKVLLVNFWATYCAPCRKEMPQLVALGERLKARGLVFVTVSADEPEQAAEASAFLDRSHVPAPAYLRKPRNEERFPLAIDPAWKNGALPASFLYDRQGRKVRAFFGELKLAELEAEIKKLL
jgi:thiol-disulfide isomerase/thioredoxin